MKRLAIVIVALVVVIGGALAIVPALVPTDNIREKLLEQVSTWLGRPVTATGEPVISLYPRPTVRIEGVTIGNVDGRDEPFMTVEVLTGSARLLPLLFGRVELSQFELTRPVIALHVDAAGEPNWNFADGAVGIRVAEAFDTTDPDPVPEVTLGRFRIEDGTISYQVGDGEPAIITEVALDIAWPATDAAASVRGGLVWRGEQIAISATLDEPLDLISQRSTTGRFRIGGAPLRIDFDGVVGRTGLDFSFSGDSAVAIPNLRRLLSWTGAAVADAPTLADAAIEGEVEWAWPLLSFANASMTLDGNVADGAFTADFSGIRPAIRGTIAADQLDLSTYALGFRTGVEADGAWSGAEIDLPILAALDWDVRFSAGRIVIGSVIIDGVAASAVVNAGDINLGIGEASLYGGRLQAAISGQLNTPHLSVDGHAVLTRMDVQPAFRDLLGVTSVTGTGSGTLDVAGAGSNWGALVEALTGTLRASIVDGSMAGIDLAMAAALTDPTVAGLTLGGDATAFATFEADFHFHGGQLETRTFLARGPAFDLAFEGAASLMRPTIDGQGIIHLHRLAGNNVVLPFRLAGTWFDPALAEDPDPMPNPFENPAAGP